MATTNPEKATADVLVPVRDLFTCATAADAISSTHTEELVIALCGPIGSPLHEVAHILDEMLAECFGYDGREIIRLSSFIQEHADKVGISIPTGNAFARINAQINAGNRLREVHGASILAELAVNQIRFGREQYKAQHGATRYKTRRVCHIIDSIKNQEEMELLRLVYGEMVYFVGVFVSLDAREANLGRRGLTRGEIHQVIDRDSGEETGTGQTVRDTFPHCDFFLRVESETDAYLKTRTERFLGLVLGSRIVTPTPYEAAMYAAASAAARSACLSRQVGAAITDAQGQLLSVGWNDVPRFGGGLYTADPQDSPSEHDNRCWNTGGKCFNDEEKSLFATILVHELRDLIPEKERERAGALIRNCARLRGLVEFSRSVHAEMHAIINAGKLAGDSMSGGKMFVTTYPCHSCARHIVAAGIREVFYIEPYRKSLAVKLHGDAISENEQDARKVRVLAYDGVAPGRFLALFRMAPDSRKENGKLRTMPARLSKPRLRRSLEALPTLEAIVVKSLEGKKLLPIANGENDAIHPGPTAA